MSRIFLALILSGVFITATAQQPARPRPSQSQPRPSDAARAKVDRGQMLAGRVVDDAGKPMVETSVMAVAAGQSGRDSKLGALNTRSATTDENGNFAFEGLSSGAYRLAVIAQGYTMAPESLKENGAAKYYRPGDTANLRMVKGGVITGTVMTQSGEPLVGVRVRVLKVKDAGGQVVRGVAIDETSLMKEWKTDDRGIYRIYGLEPGRYLVSAGGKGFNPMSIGEFDSDAPSYYPTGTRDMAAEVGVRAGQESAGIDIRYRDNKGHIISGNLTASEATNSQVNIAMLMLTNAATGGLESWTMSGMFGEQTTEGKRPFALTSVPDGEYHLSATSTSTSVLGGLAGTTFVAPPRRVTVKGSDVTGLELTLSPLGSLAGQFVIENSKAADGKPACPNSRKVALEEVVIVGRSEARNRAASALKMPASLSLFSVSAESTPDEKGAFKILTTESSRYHLEIQLPTEDLYIRSIALPKTTATSQTKDTVARQANATPTKEAATVNASKEEAAKQMKDAARNGIPLKLGEKIDNILITAAEGAAGLQGQIKAEKEGDTVPARLRIFLLPAEAENLDDVLRFFETDMQKEGAFSIRNIPPGRYYIMTRVVNEEADEANPRPVAWDGDLRKLLHTEAEAKNLLIELQPCQRLSNFVLRYATSAPAKKAEPKKASN
jgi:protocatechuate 3,4-dioxygenase beta subunit